jgi:uncharacterized protein with FMN-binding domain
VRTTTKSAIGLLSLGVLVASYTAGTAAELNTFGAAAPAATAPAQTGSSTQTPKPTETATPSAAQTADATTAATSASAQTKTPTPTQATAQTTAVTATVTSTPTPTPSATKTTTATISSGSKTGTAINYRYGTIQVEVIKSGSKISAVNLIQATTKGREYAAVPPMLVTAALAAQGSGFGNVSGATFTTDAFKQALESALAKF